MDSRGSYCKTANPKIRALLPEIRDTRPVLQASWTQQVRYPRPQGLSPEERLEGLSREERQRLRELLEREQP